MPTFIQSIYIEVAPARVWHVLANAGRFDLQSADTREEVTSSQKQGVGTTLRVVRRVGPLAIVLNGRVTEWEDARVLASEWSSGLPFAIVTRVRMTLAKEADGTRFDREYRVQVRLPLISAIIELLLTRNTSREMQTLVERIKQAAENM